MLEHLDKRRERAVVAAWRAAAVDDDLWQETGATSQLRVDELHAIVDRRLHGVELTEYRLGSGARPERIGTSSVRRRYFTKRWRGASLTGRVESSLVDDLPHRSIEAPSLTARDVRGDAHQGLIPDGVIDTVRPRFADDVGTDSVHRARSQQCERATLVREPAHR